MGVHTPPLEDASANVEPEREDECAVLAEPVAEEFRERDRNRREHEPERADHSPERRPGRLVPAIDIIDIQIQPECREDAGIKGQDRPDGKQAQVNRIGKHRADGGPEPIRHRRVFCDRRIPVFLIFEDEGERRADSKDRNETGKPASPCERLREDLREPEIPVGQNTKHLVHEAPISDHPRALVVVRPHLDPEGIIRDPDHRRRQVENKQKHPEPCQDRRAVPVLPAPVKDPKAQHRKNPADKDVGHPPPEPAARVVRDLPHHRIGDRIQNPADPRNRPDHPRAQPEHHVENRKLQRIDEPVPHHHGGIAERIDNKLGPRRGHGHRLCRRLVRGVHGKRLLSVSGDD